MVVPSARAVAWQNRSVTEIHPHPSLPLEGEGAKRSCVVIGCRGTIVLIELARSEEHTSELQSLMRISYAVFCLKKKTSRTPMQIPITIDPEQTYTNYNPAQK